ncbi:MAG: Tex family protein, partial [Lachnospiraceae bacterium]|nr:Tex family protein [Lachnospiraceae bacterium]
MDIIQKIKEELQVEKWQVEAAVKLIDEGNTIPFISRYRKEATGSLNDEQLRNLDERLTYLRNLEEKKAQVLSSIEEQGKLTEELKKKIEEAQTLVVVEDLYRPYRPKKKTRASVAREKGLEGLAQFILSQDATEEIEKEAVKYLSEEKEVTDVSQAIAGAKDIIAEMISDEADYRSYIRQATMEEGKITSSVKDEKTESVYEMYYNYEEPVSKVAGHRILALNRGEKEKILTVKIEAPVERILRYLEKQVIEKENQYTTPILQAVVEDSYERLIAPAIEREIRNDLTEKAEDGAISVFGKNLEQLLMQPPITGKVVLGWDPAFRTGCKLAVVDETGKVLDTKVIYPTAPQNKVKEAKEELKKLIKKYHVSLISVGNGTASRESEQVIVELIKELDTPVQYVIVNEAGASVYSASKLATEEFPNFDVGQRSAASIARRLQDPLAELVKIDPKSIGVGQYQHDMNQKKLGESLNGVVEDSVNKVGVDLNTASASLLEYISGISKTIAKNIVDYREKNGRFDSRSELLKVEKLGPKAYEQCAGFLRINDGKNPLDATSVHPESYEATKKLLEKLGMTMDDVKELQKKAAEKKTDSVNKKKAPEKKQTKKVVVRNTNTAMGKALAQALGSTSLENTEKKEK